MKFNYLIALGTASTALIGYFVYRKYKNHNNIQKKEIPRYDDVMEVFKKLVSDMCTEFVYNPCISLQSTIYPLIIESVVAKKDSIELHEKILEKFVHMVEHSKKMFCEAAGFTLEEFNRIIEENEDNPNVEEYNEGFKTMCNVLIETNYPPKSVYNYNINTKL